MMIAERVDEVLRRQLGNGIDWNADTSLMSGDGLSLDSLDIVRLVMGLEEEFALEIPDDAFWTDVGPRAGKVRDLVAYIDKRLAAKPALFA